MFKFRFHQKYPAACPYYILAHLPLVNSLMVWKLSLKMVWKLSLEKQPLSFLVLPWVSSAKQVPFGFKQKRVAGRGYKV